MSLSPALAAELQKLVVTMFGALAIDLPGPYALRLCDGAADIGFGGDTYSGADPIYGAIESVNAFSDGLDNEDPTLDIALLPPTNAAAALVAAPGAQGSAVRLYVGAVNVTTGQVIADPELRFVGVLDTVALEVGVNTRRLRITVVSVFERFFSDDEGVRLSDAWHQSIYPGETGLAAVTGVGRSPTWGSDAPVAAVTGAPSGGTFTGIGGSPFLTPRFG